MISFSKRLHSVGALLTPSSGRGQSRATFRRPTSRHRSRARCPRTRRAAGALPRRRTPWDAT